MVARKKSKQLITVWLEEAMVKRIEKFGRKHGLNKTDTVKAALTFYLAHLEKGIVPEKPRKATNKKATENDTVTVVAKVEKVKETKPIMVKVVIKDEDVGKKG